jgi:hypothetical protein
MCACTSTAHSCACCGVCICRDVFPPVLLNNPTTQICIGGQLHIDYFNVSVAELIWNKLAMHYAKKQMKVLMKVKSEL